MPHESSLYDLFELHPEDREPYLDGILYRGQMVFLVGAQKTGKSYIADQMAVCLAAGRDWGLQEGVPNGKVKVPKPRNVLIYQTEGNDEDLAERTNPMFELLSESERASANERFLGVYPDAIDLTGTTGVNLLEKYIKDNEIEVLIVDSLFSSIRGSFSLDSVMIEFRATMIRILRDNPQLSIIFIHHEHRPLRDRDRNLINEGANAYAGSWVIAAMADMFWIYTREANEDGERRRFETAFARMRGSGIDSFYVLQDHETGLIIPDAASLSDKIREVRREFIRRQRMTSDQYQNFCIAAKIAPSSRARYLRDLVSTKVLIRNGKRGNYEYVWVGKERN